MVTSLTVGRVWRTLRHLEPHQPIQRLLLRGRLAAERKFRITSWRYRRVTASPHSYWPQTFVPIDERIVDVPEALPGNVGTFQILGTRINLLGAGFGQEGLPQLVNYHVHYWDWAWHLLRFARSERLEVFAELFRAWKGSTLFPHGDAWSPYVVSLRAWSWCTQYDSMVKDGPVDEELRKQLRVHMRFIRSHLERDVGGNHLLKNIKAWLALAVFFGDESDINKAVRELEGQIAIQILQDGGHFERAPAYHLQVMGDLVDLQNLMWSVGRNAIAEHLGDVIGQMRAALSVLLDPTGQLILVNDGYPAPKPILEAVTPEVRLTASTMLPDTGYGRLTAGQWQVLVDVGDPCPDSLPAHAHADTLGCIIFYGKARLASEAFTSTYEAGSRRCFERSTAAHSTVEINGTDSTEVWGVFRAGRRARVHDVDFKVEGSEWASVSAWHDGYRHLPSRSVHHRRVEVDRSGVTVVDTITSERPTPFVLRWHLDNYRDGARDSHWHYVSDTAALCVTGPVKVAVVPGSQAVNFGQRRDIHVLEARGEVSGKAVIKSRFEEWDHGSREARLEGAE